jgi:hypothetical protein
MDDYPQILHDAADHLTRISSYRGHCRTGAREPVDSYRHTEQDDLELHLFYSPRKSIIDHILGRDGEDEYSIHLDRGDDPWNEYSFILEEEGLDTVNDLLDGDERWERL